MAAQNRSGSTHDQHSSWRDRPSSWRRKRCLHGDEESWVYPGRRGSASSSTSPGQQRPKPRDCQARAEFGRARSEQILILLPAIDLARFLLPSATQGESPTSGSPQNGEKAHSGSPFQFSGTGYVSNPLFFRQQRTRYLSPSPSAFSVSIVAVFHSRI